MVCSRGESLTHHANQMKLFKTIAAVAVIGASFIAATSAEARCTMFVPNPPVSKAIECSKAVVVKQKNNMIHYRIYSNSTLFADVVLENNKTGSLQLVSNGTFYHGYWERNGNEVTLLFENYRAFSYFV